MDPARLGRIASPWDRLSLVFFLALAALLLLTFRDYGISSDEVAHVGNGPLVLEYYRSLFSEGLTEHTRSFHDHATYSLDMHRYGGLLDGISAAIWEACGTDPVATSHLLDGLVGWLGILGCWRLAHRLAGPKTAFFAAVMLALVPAYYGHMFNNPKDPPFAAAYVWALVYLVDVVAGRRPVAAASTVKLGIAMGVCMGIRAGGLLLPVYLVGGWVARELVDRTASGRARARPAAEVLTSGALVIVPAIAIAYGIMLLSWPWTHGDPLFRPLASLQTVTDRALPQITVLFDGAQYTPNTLPRSYLVRHLLLQLPEVVSLLILVSPLAVFSARARSPLLGSSALVALAAVFPLAYAAARHAPVYNGYRHFLFVVPPLVVLASISLSVLHDAVARRSRNAANVVLAIAAGFGILVAGQMVRLHPYQYLWYNGVVGGIRGAEGSYELDYYCHSYAEAVRRLHGTLQREHGSRYADMKFVVFTDDHPFSSTPVFPPNWIHSKDRDGADYVISKRQDLTGQILLTVERDGVVLNFVRQGAGEPRGTARCFSC